jgi:heptosyltransferase-2/heptosyltransferase-3
MAIASGMFRPLKKAMPCARIVLFANEYAGRIARHIPGIDAIVPYEGFMKGGWWRCLVGRKRPAYQVGIDLNTDYPIASAMVVGCASQTSLGFDISGRGVFFSEAVPEPGSGSHMIDYYLEPVRRIDPSISGGRPHLIAGPDLWDRMRARLQRVFAEKSKKTVLLHPGAHFSTQRWPSAYFARAADGLAKQEEMQVVLIGGPAEKELLRSITGKMHASRFHCFSDLTIDELIGALAHADLLVCNNSGPLHIAAAVGTPTVSTMGPTVKHLWIPVGDIHRVLRIDTLPCIGCNLGYCRIGTHACMREITPSMMIDAVMEQLGQPRGSAQPNPGGLEGS